MIVYRVLWVGLLVIFLSACDRDRARAPEEPDPALVNRALVWGEMRANEVTFFAQEMTMLHPNSQRSQDARRTRIELDDILREKTGVEEGEDE